MADPVQTSNYYLSHLVQIEYRILNYVTWVKLLQKEMILKIIAFWKSNTRKSLNF
jgi:hypothetical protein